MVSGVELLSLLRPYVRHCGDARRGPWSMSSRRLLDYLLVHIAEGSGRFVIAGQAHDAQPGDLFWMPPDTPHSMEGHAPSMVCPYVHFDLVYRPEVSHWDFTIPGGMEDLAELKPLLHPPFPHAQLATLCGRLRLHNSKRVGNLIVDICAEAARAQPFAPLRMSGLMLEIIAEILRGQTGLQADANEHSPGLEEAAEYLRRHCAEKAPLKEVAQLCRLSPSHFRSLFARHFGCPPREYIRMARIHQAKSLIVGSNLNLSEIAYKTGFATVHSFSRAFHQMEGIAPSSYRKCGQIVGTRVDGRQASYRGARGGV
jgi:AraC-like DNA-binding protein